MATNWMPVHRPSPEAEAASAARAAIFFAECRAAHDALVARNVAAVLAAEAALAQAAPLGIAA